MQNVKIWQMKLHKRQILQYKQYGRILFENRAKEKGRGVGR